MKTGVLLLLIILFLPSCLSLGDKNTHISDDPVTIQTNEEEEEHPSISSTEPIAAEEKELREESVPIGESEILEEISVYHASPAGEAAPPGLTDLPLPSYEILFYHYLPLGESGDPAPVNLALPTYHKPKPTTSSTPTPVKTIKAEPAEKEEPVESPLVKEETSFDPEIREERFSLGLPAPLILPGTDWVYLGEENGAISGFTNRNVFSDSTIFSFTFPKTGTYNLLFFRQDHSTGDSDQETIRVVVFEGDPSVTDTPISDTSLTDSQIDLVDTSPEKPNEPLVIEVTEVESRLDTIEDNPEKVEETLELLEFLTHVESDDETLAGYYYRMARVLEMNSRAKDLRKAYDTYEYIVNNFFLTTYYELSEERIRFLDRHFFKLQ